MLRAGKTLCVVRVDIFDDQRRLSATSIVTYLLLERPPAVVAAGSNCVTMVLGPYSSP
jgi:hypothetical protein